MLVCKTCMRMRMCTPLRPETVRVRAGGNKPAFGFLFYACVLVFGPVFGPQFLCTRARSAQTGVWSAPFFTWRMVHQRCTLTCAPAPHTSMRTHTSMQVFHDAEATPGSRSIEGQSLHRTCVCAHTQRSVRARCTCMHAVCMQVHLRFCTHIHGGRE